MKARRFHPVSFEQWQQARLDETPADEQVDCPKCDGSGEVECDCCGHESECDDCEEGQVAWGDLTDAEKRRHLTHDRYTRAVFEDAKAFASWLGLDPGEMLVAAGFRVSMSVSSRRLKVETMEAA